jgi:small-conductance mechanosensitive channel
MISTWSSVFQASLQDIWLGTAEFLPKLVVALLIFVVGWIFGGVVDRVIAQVIKALKIDNILRSAKLDQLLNKAGFNLDAGKFLGGLVKWFIIVVFLVASLDVLGLTQVNAFLNQVVLLYLPKVIVAALIILVAAVIADFTERVVVGAAKAAEIRTANLAGKVTRWAIWVFAILAALFQLGIAAAFVQTLFTGIIVAVSLALGLSFGLGGQDAAARFIEKVRGEISAHHHQ